MAIDTKITMESAITHLGLQHQFEIVAGKKDYTCPVCGKKKKLNINFQKGMYNCNYCGFSGNGVHFWAHFRGFGKDTSAAGTDYNNYLLGKQNEGKVVKVEPLPAPKVKEFEIASVSERNKAYTEFLKMLSLADVHKQNLLKRGLSEEAIMRGGYKSAPDVASNAICHDLLLKGIALEGVPGFYKERGEWRFVNYGSGFLIPSRNLNGQIQGMQIRRDVANKNAARYLTVSSAEKECGTKGHTYPHINCGSGDLKRVILTEGPLKGDIITHYTGIPVLAILGVKAQAALPGILKELKAKGTRRIDIAFDMDLYSNEHVQSALYSLKKTITSIGFRQCQLDWDKSQKGLDDYLHSLHENRPL